MISFSDTFSRSQAFQLVDELYNSNLSWYFECLSITYDSSYQIKEQF